MRLILAVGLTIEAGGLSLGHSIPLDLLLHETKAAGVPAAPGSPSAMMAAGAVWITYFAALYLNFCDFSRYAPSAKVVRRGNLWGLPVNLILFSLVAGVIAGALIYFVLCRIPAMHRPFVQAGSRGLLAGHGETTPTV